MIDLYTWPTPNGHKIHIMLEETGLPYKVIPIDIEKGEQFAPAFMEISPNNRIPAIHDPDGPDGQAVNLFESGAILIYLAEKAGKFLSGPTLDKYKVLQWLMFQMGGIGPMIGQFTHFDHYAPIDIPYAKERYGNETTRLHNVLETRLGHADYLAGEYSIADMATYPWVRGYQRHGIDLADYPNYDRWRRAIEGRAAVGRAYRVLAGRHDINAPASREMLENFFGATQYERR